MQIRGFYEFGHTLDVLNADSHGFSPADVAHVDRFWAYGDMHDSSAGFVIQLRDGRHAYVEFLHWHGFEQDEDFRIDVEMLEDQEAPSAPLREPIDPSAPWPPGGWSAETAHLDRLLLQGEAAS
ncbi:MAG: hypothetical protein KA171_14990 [Reyranella sp.]|nr:hypothetical protein [Reyranella sp.]